MNETTRSARSRRTGRLENVVRLRWTRRPPSSSTSSTVQLPQYTLSNLQIITLKSRQVDAAQWCAEDGRSVRSSRVTHWGTGWDIWEGFAHCSNKAQWQCTYGFSFNWCINGDFHYYRSFEKMTLCRPYQMLFLENFHEVCTHTHSTGTHSLLLLCLLYSDF